MNKQKRVFITGDLHAGHDGRIDDIFEFEEDYCINHNIEFTKDDTLIILGDFGYIFAPKPSITEEIDLEMFKDFGFTTAFIDGNHDNHPRINAFPEAQWHGGKVHQINESLYHLCRGEVFQFGDKKIMTIGGAASIDKEWRVEGESWWATELLSKADEDNIFDNLEKNKDIDIILTHTCPTDMIPYLGYFPKLDPTNKVLQEVWDRTSADWYFGHFHEDKVLDIPFNRICRCLMRDFVRIV